MPRSINVSLMSPRTQNHPGLKISHSVNASDSQEGSADEESISIWKQSCLPSHFSPFCAGVSSRLYYRAITNFKGSLRVVCVQTNVCQALWLISEHTLWGRGEELAECLNHFPKSTRLTSAVEYDWIVPNLCTLGLVLRYLRLPGRDTPHSLRPGFCGDQWCADILQLS